MKRTTRSTAQANGPRRTLFCLGGVSGVGKSSIQHLLLTHYPDDVVFARRVTDRPLRPDETDRDVLLLSRPEFISTYRAGQIIGPLATNHYLYGMSLAEVRTSLAGPKRWVGVISMGAGVHLRSFHAAFPAVFPAPVLVYLRVSRPEMLARRLKERGHTPTQIEARLHEYFDSDREWASLADYLVQNDDGKPIEETLREVVQLLGLPQHAPVAAS